MDYGDGPVIQWSDEAGGMGAAPGLADMGPFDVQAKEARLTLCGKRGFGGAIQHLGRVCDEGRHDANCAIAAVRGGDGGHGGGSRVGV